MVSIYSIGHSNLDLDRFVDALRRYGIGTIVDVRSAPYSKYSPQYNRPDLERSLREVGVGYEYLGDTLGGRPTDAGLYRPGCVPEKREDYLKCVDYGLMAKQPWFERSIEQLLRLAGAGAVAVLCSEENPEECHRHYLIEVAIANRARFQHIRTSKGRIYTEDVAIQASLF